MRNITIGQFYNVDSILHRLDPRVKIIMTCLYLIVLFIDKNPVLYGIQLLVLFLMIKMSEVPAKFIFRGTKSLWIIVAVTGLMNLFTVKGTTTIFQWGVIRITESGIAAAVYTVLRLFFMMIVSGMMTYTTTPNALTKGLEKMLDWMKKLGMPVHAFAIILSIALRFVPVMVEELDKIMRAQMARGMDFKEGNVIKRVGKLVPIIIPLMISALKRSEELAMAMDARCYNSIAERTQMKPLIYKKRDYFAYGLLGLYLVGAIAVAILF